MNTPTTSTDTPEIGMECHALCPGRIDRITERCHLPIGHDDKHRIWLTAGRSYLRWEGDTFPVATEQAGPKNTWWRVWRRRN